MQIAQDSLAQARVEIVVQNFYYTAKMLELLELLSVGADRHQDRTDAIAKNPVRERWCMIWILDCQ